jgi:tetratricopeptide (TPR) repeat protein
MTRKALLAALLAPLLALAPAAPRADTSAQPPSGQATAAGEPLAAVLAEIDATWSRRDDPAVLATQQARLQEAMKQAPGDYGVLWRVARLNFWLSDDPREKGSEKSRLGKIAWDYGDRAAAANPKGVEGWHYAAAGVGNYALGIGVITALRQGIEGKFKERISKAESIDPSFENGAIQTAWGRFWYELPWPKYSASRSQKALEEALGKNPDNVRAHVYLADLFAKENQPARATTELQRALAKPPGRYDAPEERRWQEVARNRLAELSGARARGSEGG